MTTWMLWIWLAYNPCDAQSGETCRAVVTESSKEFFNEKDCVAARRTQISAFHNTGFKRYTAECHKRSGPFLEPPATAEKQQ
jgi:hypothetical protein